MREAGLEGSPTVWTLHSGSVAAAPFSRHGRAQCLPLFRWQGHFASDSTARLGDRNDPDGKETRHSGDVTTAPEELALIVGGEGEREGRWREREQMERERERADERERV